MKSALENGDTKRDKMILSRLQMRSSNNDCKQFEVQSVSCREKSH